MLPHWIGMPGVILLIAFIAYAWQQGSKVQSRGEGSGRDANVYPPPIPTAPRTTDGE
jgi:hypothetical protein